MQGTILTLTMYIECLRSSLYGVGTVQVTVRIKEPCEVVGEEVEG